MNNRPDMNTFSGFYVSKFGDYLFVTPKHSKESYVHVIEYSWYEALLERTNDDIIKLKEKIKVLKKKKRRK